MKKTSFYEFYGKMILKGKQTDYCNDCTIYKAKLKDSNYWNKSIKLINNLTSIWIIKNS